MAIDTCSHGILALGKLVLLAIQEYLIDVIIVDVADMRCLNDCCDRLLLLLLRLLNLLVVLASIIEMSFRLNYRGSLILFQWWSILLQ